MLNLFSKKQLRPVWQYTCDGILWRLKVSNNRLILGEDRNTEAKTVSYFCVEETTGKILWKNLKFDEPFWIGINAVYNNVAYFHEYESPSMPEQKKIIAVDILNGKQLWKNNDLKFLFAHNSFLYATKDSFEKRFFFELDSKTGTILREINDTNELNALHNQSEETQPYHSLQLPTLILKDEFLSNSFYKHLLKNIPLQKLSGDFEIFENENYLVICFYENTNENPFELKLNQHLHIYDKAKFLRQVFVEIITTNASLTLLDTFFVKNNFLYFIKDKKNLTAINLKSSI